MLDSYAIIGLGKYRASCFYPERPDRRQPATATRDCHVGIGHAFLFCGFRMPFGAHVSGVIAFMLTFCHIINVPPLTSNVTPVTNGESIR